MSRSSHTIRPASRQSGFTIVELMVAMAVLATLLLLASVTLINLGRIFSKGTNEAHLQNATRNVMSELASSIQLGGYTPVNPVVPTGEATIVGGGQHPSSVSELCVGNQRYTYVLNYRPSSGSPYKHALWRDTMNQSAICPYPGDGNLTDNLLDLKTSTPSDSYTATGSVGTDLIPANMRLTDLQISFNGNGTYTITVSMIYGDDDLYTFNATRTPTTLCNGGVGQEYCAVSSLTETVTQRVIAQ